MRILNWSAGLLVGIVALAANPGLALDLKAWELATNPETKERYIPVEVWSGAEWDGKRELQMPQVDASYRHPEAPLTGASAQWPGRRASAGWRFSVFGIDTASSLI